MYERVIEIIVYIVNELRTHHAIADNKQFESLSRKLVDDGYTENEISFAFSWIFEKIKLDTHRESKTSVIRTHRILHEFEKIAISTSAYGYLIQLREFDLIDDWEMEMIIERALLSERTPVSESEIKDIISSVVFKPDDMIEGSLFLLDKSYNVH